MNLYQLEDDIEALNGIEFAYPIGGYSLELRVAEMFLDKKVLQETLDNVSNCLRSQR